MVREISFKVFKVEIETDSAWCCHYASHQTIRGVNSGILKYSDEVTAV